MRKTTIAIALTFALGSTAAFAQAGGNTAGGSSQSGGPAASKTTTGTPWMAAPPEAPTAR